MNLEQLQKQTLSQQQLQSITLLQMGTLELEQYIQELALENPLIEPEPADDAPPAQEAAQTDCRARWQEEYDWQNRFYTQGDSDGENDPLLFVGTDGGFSETLLSFLTRQLEQLPLSELHRQNVCYLAACLDDDGYFRIPAQELAKELGVSAGAITQALDTLRSLEPAGVGAADLADCLALQLRRIGAPAYMVELVRGHLALLANQNDRALAKKLGITEGEAAQARRTIRELEPRPGYIFQAPQSTQYIRPDVYIQERDGQFFALIPYNERPPFSISPFYRSMLQQSPDAEVKAYLGGKLRQAETVLWAVNQRGGTLLRCAQVIAARQEAFFRRGPCALQPLRLADVAQELGLHVSTISRAVRQKYVQCAQGCFPMIYFFSHSACAAPEQSGTSAAAAKAQLKKLIEQEDRAAPYSDQQLCRLMEAGGCSLSRRTVAKYRGELNLPGVSGRRAH